MLRAHSRWIIGRSYVSLSPFAIPGAKARGALRPRQEGSDVHAGGARTISVTKRLQNDVRFGLCARCDARADPGLERDFVRFSGRVRKKSRVGKT
jgi:hypothetical protein